MVRKGVITLLVTLVAVLYAISPCLAEEELYSYFKHVQLVIGEKEAEVNFQPAVMEYPAYIKDGRTLVPFRFLGEALGAEVLWDKDKSRAILKLGDSEVIVTIGSRVAYVNGRMKTLDVPPEITRNRTYIPLRFVSESLGAYVDYFAESQTIEVSYAEKSSWKEFTAPVTELKYVYPEDWTVSTEIEDVFVTFTSPRGSEMWVYWADNTPGEAISILKKKARESDWSLMGEDLVDPRDPNKGYKLDFTTQDPKTNTNWMYVVYVDPMSGGSFVSEQVIKDDLYFRMENVVMLYIAYS